MFTNIKIISQQVSSVVSVLAVFCVLLLSNSAKAEFKIENIKKMDFRAAGIYLTNNTGNSFSSELSWNPSYAFTSDWTLLGNIGVSPLKGKSGTFIMSEFGVLGGYKINQSFEVEAGAGLQAWSGQSTASMINVNALWNIGTPYLGLFDRLFVGYSLVNQDASTSEFKIGITMSFGSENNSGGANATK
jgi:hypothetical protein